MGCLWHTRYLTLIIGIDEKGNACTCSDGAHRVHVDGKGHSEIFFTMDRGAIMNVSKNLRLLETSSAETEIVSNGERFH